VKLPQLLPQTFHVGNDGGQTVQAFPFHPSSPWCRPRDGKIDRQACRWTCRAESRGSTVHGFVPVFPTRIGKMVRWCGRDEARSPILCG
jgi:hypothetical protein